MKTPAELFSLKGRVAVVIGGTGVLCGEMAEGFAAAGAAIAIVGRDAARAKVRLDNISRYGVAAEFFSCDTTSKTGLQKLLAERPDATLAELGAGLDRPFRTSTVDLWLRQLGWTYKKNPVRRRTKSPRRGGKKNRLA